MQAASVCPLQLRAVQQWRWALLRALHQDCESRHPAALPQHYEQLLFVWMRLRKAVAALLAAVQGGEGMEEEGNEWAESRQRWAVAAEQLDVSAGIAAGEPPPKPLLWKHGGRPLLPHSAPLSAAYCRLLALCDTSR